MAQDLESPHSYGTSGWAHLDTTTNVRGSASRNAAFTLQHGAMLTLRQPDRRRADPGCAGGFAEARAALWRAAKAEGCVPVVVSSCAPPALTVAEKQGN